MQVAGTFPATVLRHFLAVSRYGKETDKMTDMGKNRTTDSNKEARLGLLKVQALHGHRESLYAQV